MFLTRVKEAMQRFHLGRPGPRIVVAVSGGSDSTALLLALHELKVRLAVAHLSHRIRGREADLDERFVRDLAARIGAPFRRGRADVPALARRGKISLEMAAREARREFLARVARRARADAIATGHTADDQAETVLMRLLRGTGPEGAGGISRESRLGSARIVRPLLEVTREEAREFLRSRGQPWREDASNRDRDVVRNRVRHDVLPFLEKCVNPSVRRALVRWADILRAENEWMDAEAAKVRFGAALPLARTRRLPLALRRRVVRRWLIERGVGPEALDFDLIERVLALKRNGDVPVSRGVRVVRSYDRLLFDRAAVARPFRVRLKVPGETKVAGAGLVAVTRGSRGIVRPPRRRAGTLPAEATISREAVGSSALYVRSWKPGDRMAPMGMSGSKKLHDIFADAKVPRNERHRIPVVECRGEIVWLPGYRVARGWEVEGARAANLRISLKSA